MEFLENGSGSKGAFVSLWVYHASSFESIEIELTSGQLHQEKPAVYWNILNWQSKDLFQRLRGIYLNTDGLHIFEEL